VRWFETVKVTLTATNTVIIFSPDELYNIINTSHSANSGKVKIGMWSVAAFEPHWKARLIEHNHLILKTN
jgi:hypothetical protein